LAFAGQIQQNLQNHGTYIKTLFLIFSFTGKMDYSKCSVIVRYRNLSIIFVLVTSSSRRLAAELSLQLLGSISAPRGIVVDKTALKQFFTKNFACASLLPFHQLSLFTLTHIQTTTYNCTNGRVFK
jgi:hypothetical protein